MAIIGCRRNRWDHICPNISNRQSIGDWRLAAVYQDAAERQQAQQRDCMNCLHSLFRIPSPT